MKWDDDGVVVNTSSSQLVIAGAAVAALRPLLWHDMQLNLVYYDDNTNDSMPDIVVLEPDFLMDVTSVAGCFARPDTHPLRYSLNRLKPKANSQAILLGNFAGAALDDIVNHTTADVSDTLWRSFREQAIQFCACDDFDGETFIADARQQFANIEEVVSQLFQTYDRERVLLEPSFICEPLGLQGRIDLMTDDFHLLVEQKSGRNHRIEQQAQVVQRTDHFVQLLLYYGILTANFHLSPSSLHPHLLYSKYPAHKGLLSVDYQQLLMRRAIEMRNTLVAWEYHFARQGPSALLSLLPPLGDTERSYFLSMAQFVYREQLCSRVAARPGQYAVSDLWRMPLDEKQRTGNIYTRLLLSDLQKSSDYGGYDLMTLAIQPEDDADYVKNFRRGDAVYVYCYDNEPDVRHSILHKGTLQEIHANRLVVRLNDGQQNKSRFPDKQWAVEHGVSDNLTTSCLYSIYQLVTCADRQRRQLLLGQRPPTGDPSLQLSRSYHPDYDEILLKAKQARDFFLLVGPPGTGKTSMALRFLVEEELATDHASSGSILLTAYTNRAVDEICDMLSATGIDYLRLGNETSCDPRFTSHLLEHRLGQRPKLTEMQALIRNIPVVVATTSMLQSRPFIFALKSFSVCIVDEASQLLEPNIVGILTQDISRFILIGDHKQLPAVVQQTDGGDCSRSLFERLLLQERNAGRTQFIGTLRKQGRMHPDVAAFTGEFFYRNEDIRPVPLPHQQSQSLGYAPVAADALDTVLMQHRVVFFDSADSDLVVTLLHRIYMYYGNRFDAQKTLGVIVPYRIEIGRIRNGIERLGIDVLNDISIDTVERYQGSQRDVIVYYFAVNDKSQLDFITATTFDDNGQTIDRKLNVAMTRAREQLIMVGNAAVMRHNALFATLIERYQQQLDN